MCFDYQDHGHQFKSNGDLDILKHGVGPTMQTTVLIYPGGISMASCLSQFSFPSLFVGTEQASEGPKMGCSTVATDPLTAWGSTKKSENSEAMVNPKFVKINRRLIHQVALKAGQSRKTVRQCR